MYDEKTLLKIQSLVNHSEYDLEALMDWIDSQLFDKEPRWEVYE